MNYQLGQFGIKATISRKVNCYDNAPMESFFGTLKTELVYHRRYETRRQAMAEIAAYIDLFLQPPAATFIFHQQKRSH